MLMYHRHSPYTDANQQVGACVTQKQLRLEHDIRARLKANALSVSGEDRLRPERMGAVSRLGAGENVLEKLSGTLSVDWRHAVLPLPRFVPVS